MSDVLQRLAAADRIPHDLARARLRVGSLEVDCRLGHPYYAERLIEFFKGNLDAVSDADGRRCDAELDIAGVPYDAEVFPGDETSFLHAILAESWPGGFSFTTCLCRVEVDTTARPVRISGLVREPCPNLDSLRIHFIRLIPKIIFAFDRYYMHASAVRFGNAVFAFTGSNHAGKSTVALRLAKETAEIVADDHVLLRRHRGRFLVSGTDRNARVCAKTEGYLFEQPLDADARLHGRLWKKEFSIDRFFSIRSYRDYPLARLYFLARGPRPDVRPMSRTQAVVRLLTLASPDTLVSDNRPGESEDYLAYFTDLLRVVPAFEVLLTDEVADLDQLAPRLLGRA
jgi:hypothetical protein